MDDVTPEKIVLVDSEAQAEEAIRVPGAGRGTKTRAGVLKALALDGRTITLSESGVTVKATPAEIPGGPYTRLSATGAGADTASALKTALNAAQRARSVATDKLKAASTDEQRAKSSVNSLRNAEKNAVATIANARKALSLAQQEPEPEDDGDEDERQLHALIADAERCKDAVDAANFEHEKLVRLLADAEQDFARKKADVDGITRRMKEDSAVVVAAANAARAEEEVEVWQGRAQKIKDKLNKLLADVDAAVQAAEKANQELASVTKDARVTTEMDHPRPGREKEEFAAAKARLAIAKKQRDAEQGRIQGADAKEIDKKYNEALLLRNTVQTQVQDFGKLCKALARRESAQLKALESDLDRRGKVRFCTLLFYSISISFW